VRRPTEIERLFAFVLENAPLIVLEIDGQGTVLFSDGAALASAGLRPGQLVGRSVLERYGQVPWLRALIEQAARGEAAAATGENGGLWFSVYCAPARGADGAIDGALALAFDVTPFKERELELRASEERLRSLSEASSEAMVLHDGGVILFANRAASALSGYTPDELIGKPIFELTPASERPRVAAHIGSGRVDPMRSLALRKDGQTSPVELRAGNVTWDGEPRTASAT
jgi:PAS domain S-box-containing protein